jgi:esterase
MYDILRSCTRSFALAAMAGAAVLTATLVMRPAAALTIFETGTSAVGTPLAVQADLSISGTTLTLVVSNFSPASKLAADDVLSSIYFDVVKDGMRPALTYESAEGLVWQVRSGAPDRRINYTPPRVPGGPSYQPVTDPLLHLPSDLRGLEDGDRTWQLRAMDPTAAPQLGFGIGTVANSLFNPPGGPNNGFDPGIVGPPGPGFIAFGIVPGGDIEPVGAPMRDQYLVFDRAVFRFTSPDLARFSDADIVPEVTFGFGTGPSTVLLPEPDAAALAGLAVGGLLGIALIRRRRRWLSAITEAEFDDERSGISMAVELAHSEWGAGPPLVILHGLFGSRRNWATVAHRLAEGRRVLAADLRNHGDSPWDELHDYPSLADDVATLVEDVEAGPAAVLGHSMGGKAAMMLALSRPDLVERLVVVDIAPARSAATPVELVRALRSVPLERFSRRADVKDALAADIPDPAIRAFLTLNLATRPEGLAWTVNLDAIERNFESIVDFPEVPRGQVYAGPVLFVVGGRSPYVQPGHRDAIERLFPRATVEVIDRAGHWVHADAPDDFLATVGGFLPQAG